MRTAKEFMDAIGREAAIDALFGSENAERSRKTINQAVWSGSFPAYWYDALDALCVEKGLVCPRTLFNWKVPK